MANDTHIVDYYAVMNLPTSADLAGVDNAYARLSSELAHLGNVDGAAATALKRLNEAYGVLGRPERRRKYDEVFLARQKELELKAARAAFRRTAMMQWFVIGALGAVLVTQGIFLAYIGRDEISSFLSSIGF
ncbi:MAG: DnaJ domain-containing protein [Dehalococcoidia bacterium]|nr:DnaJ domain-containing protein [Dehalococcoidia bacterium]MCB9484662.1 DnaJ domain-containing protein [Thermoflexaceae bacterium]